MKILEFDAGNSRLKWRLVSEKQVMARGHLVNSDSWLRQLPLLLDQLGEIDGARASVVSGSERYDVLSTVIHQCRGMDLLQAKVQPFWQGVKVAYEDPSQLGVDRWLAMLGAHDQEPGRNKVIVDCGTAITIDLVDQQGVHHGGYIIPGVTLMKTALKANTANLDLVQQLPESIGPGRNRSECINQGVLAMVVAMINAQLNHYSDSVVYVTGGDGCLLEPFVDAQCRLIPELVMDGLALAFEGFEESHLGRANALGCS